MSTVLPEVSALPASPLQIESINRLVDDLRARGLRVPFCPPKLSSAQASHLLGTLAEMVTIADRWERLES